VQNTHSYLATEQWFLKISEVKELMLNEVDRVKWFPVWAGSSRFKDWVSNARDWCISRQRYWGIPIPIWECQDGHIRVVESPEELGITDEMQLHRPAIDEVILTCKCGKPMKRIPDVFDVWFDSGVASWATIGYPKNSEGFEKLWPADFITEGHDQTRGWFYSQLGTSAVAFGKAPYKKVLMHGFTLDEKGRKMSKSLGNVVAPEEVIERVGVDAFRLYVLSSNAPWEDIRFNWSEVENAFRTLNILWNSCRFAFPYMKLDDFRYDGLHEVDQHFLPEDRWIISRVQALAEEVSRNIEVFEFHRAIRTIEHFILEDLSRWYIQLVRPRAWEEKHSPTKLAGYNTIIYVMDRLLRIIAPFTPYISEKLYQTLIKVFNPKAEISVHLTEFPKPEEKLLKPDLEKHMKIVREAVEAVLGARQKGKRKLRWPIERVIVETKDEEVIQALKNLSDIFLTQTNARNIEFTESWKEYELSIRPNYKVLGPVFKEHTKEFFQFLMSFEPKKIKEMVEQEKEVEFRGNKIILSSEMVEIDEELPEYLVAEEFSGGRVLIDLSMTEDILKEGFAREITRRIQDMRKEMDLRVEEFINVWIEWDGEVDLKEWESYISNETRAKKLHFSGIEPDVKEDGFIKKWEVEGKNIIIGVKRA
jgi:isoleucyl-tRNA synthetase